MPWSDGQSLQFRWEVYNVSNTPIFNVQTAQLAFYQRPTFGNYTSLLNQPRVLQFALRYEVPTFREVSPTRERWSSSSSKGSAIWAIRAVAQLGARVASAGHSPAKPTAWQLWEGIRDGRLGRGRVHR